MFPKRFLELTFDIILCSLWITATVSDTRPNEEDDLEHNLQHPFLTPTTNTEPIHHSTSTSAASKEVTSENASKELYDQILPSRDPTTPLSRNYFHKMWSNYQYLETPSTLATTINAPPPIHSPKHSNF